MFDVRSQNKTEGRGRSDYRPLTTALVGPRSTSGDGPIVRNKANSHRMGRNKHGPAGLPMSLGPSVRNKANSRTDRKGRRARRAERRPAPVRNKANFGGT